MKNKYFTDNSALYGVIWHLFRVTSHHYYVPTIFTMVFLYQRGLMYTPTIEQTFGLFAIALVLATHMTIYRKPNDMNEIVYSHHKNLRLLSAVTIEFYKPLILLVITILTQLMLPYQARLHTGLLLVSLTAMFERTTENLQYFYYAHNQNQKRFNPFRKFRPMPVLYFIVWLVLSLAGYWQTSYFALTPNLIRIGLLVNALFVRTIGKPFNRLELKQLGSTPDMLNGLVQDTWFNSLVWYIFSVLLLLPLPQYIAQSAFILAVLSTFHLIFSRISDWHFKQIRNAERANKEVPHVKENQEDT